MSRIIRNTLLEYVAENLTPEETVNPLRIYDFNNKKLGKGAVIYLCEREIRAKDNFALQFASQKSKELALPLKIIHPKVTCQNAHKQEFIDRNIKAAHKDFSDKGYDFKIIDNENLFEYLKKLHPSLMIIDFNPISNREAFKIFPFKILETDGHNIVPARFVSNKQEYNAATFRRKVYYNIFPFLTKYPTTFKPSIPAEFALNNFIIEKLQYYSEFKNNPKKNFTSGLSKYINLGFISSQRAVIEVINSNVSKINKEAFLEELIIRKELSDNFCLYNKNFKTFKGIPNWAYNSIENHRGDLRPYIYSLEQFEKAETHDKLWNFSQKQLTQKGTIHGYLRMYWGKKIMEWSSSPEDALEIAIYLNDKYAYDAPSPNGYVGVLWALGGLHDRAFKDWFITGKIRRMTAKSILGKYDLL